MNQVINFEKTRDFGAKLNATFEFIRQNFKPLMKSISFICGPAIVMLGIFYGNYQKYALDLTRVINDDSFLTAEVLTTLGGLILFGFISQLLLVTTILEYVNIYRAKESNLISVDEVWSQVKSSIGKVAISTIALFFGLMLLGFIMALFAFAMQEAPVGIFFIFFIFFILVMYVFIALSLFYNILLQEGKSASDIGYIVSRCFKLVKSKWWSTFGLIFVAGILRGAMAFIFSIPMMILMFSGLIMTQNPAEAFQDQSLGMEAALMTASVIAMLGSSLLYCIPMLAITFQYFNLVEMKEAKGLMGDIESLGDTKQEDDSEETY